MSEREEEEGRGVTLKVRNANTLKEDAKMEFNMEALFVC